MIRIRGNNKGLAFAAFGAGLILALCFPTRVMLFILAAMLVVLGVMCYARWIFGGFNMKVVVVKSPKALRGILKMIFKIKDEK